MKKTWHQNASAKKMCFICFCIDANIFFGQKVLGPPQIILISYGHKGPRQHGYVGPPLAEDEHRGRWLNLTGQRWIYVGFC